MPNWFFRRTPPRDSNGRSGDNVDRRPAIPPVWHDIRPNAPESSTLRRILVVDDDAALRLLLRTTLAADEFEVEEAATISEAEALARFRRPAAVILDVLHYMPIADQDAVLARVRRALAPGGLLLLRVGDADAGLPFRLSNWVDWTVAFVRGHGATRFHCRSVAQWRSALEALGFTVRAEPMSRGTPFANVLLAARVPG